jgi:hypothetical protein
MKGVIMSGFKLKGMAVLMIAGVLSCGMLDSGEWYGGVSERYAGGIMSAGAENQSVEDNSLYEFAMSSALMKLFTDATKNRTSTSLYPEVLFHPFLIGLLILSFLGLALIPEPYQLKREFGKRLLRKTSNGKSSRSAVRPKMTLGRTGSISSGRCAEKKNFLF